MYIRENSTKHGAAGTPYYVGKGKGMRAYNRHHRISTPKNPAMIVFVLRDVSEADAFREEKRLIAIYGRIDNGTGCLANLTDGGEGLSGRKFILESKIKCSQAVRNRWANTTLEKRRSIGAKISSKNRGKKRSSQFRKYCSDRQKNKEIPVKLTNEGRASLSIKMKLRNSVKTIDELRESGRKAARSFWESATEEEKKKRFSQHSIKMKAWHANRTPEERKKLTENANKSRWRKTQ